MPKIKRESCVVEFMSRPKVGNSFLPFLLALLDLPRSPSLSATFPLFV